jgi:hypothetical protein
LPWSRASKVVAFPGAQTRGNMPPISSCYIQIKSMLLNEVVQIEGFMRLLMKRRNGNPWTVEERRALAQHLNALAKAVPALIIFSLPGGMVLLPALAWFLDRRRDKIRRLRAAAELSAISQTENVDKGDRNPFGESKLP